MPAVNPTLHLPALPDWLTMESCECCGDLYKDHRGMYDFGQAHMRIREAAKREGDDGGGFRSRGPVLWAMRILKAEDWLLTHIGCGPLVKIHDEWNEWDPAF